MRQHILTTTAATIALILAACGETNGQADRGPDAADPQDAARPGDVRVDAAWDAASQPDAAPEACIDTLEATVEGMAFCGGAPTGAEFAYTWDASGQFVVGLTFGCDATMETLGCVLTWPAGGGVAHLNPPPAVLCMYADHRIGTSLTGGRNAGPTPAPMDDPLIGVSVVLSEDACFAGTVDSWVGGADPSGSDTRLRRNVHLRVGGRLAQVE